MVSVVPVSAAATQTESVTANAPEEIVIVAVCGENPNIPSASGASFHSSLPTGEVPSSGYTLVSTCVACL